MHVAQVVDPVHGISLMSCDGSHWIPDPVACLVMVRCWSWDPAVYVPSGFWNAHGCEHVPTFSQSEYSQFCDASHGGTLGHGFVWIKSDSVGTHVESQSMQNADVVLSTSQPLRHVCVHVLEKSLHCLQHVLVGVVIRWNEGVLIGGKKRGCTFRLVCVFARVGVWIDIVCAH